VAGLLETLRSVRVGRFAVFDFVTAHAGMYWLAPRIGISHERALWLTIPIGIATHHLLGIETPLNRMVLGDKPSRLAQLIVAGLLLRALTLRKEQGF
jgi:hypothetical protein